jgi:hypothetical protein
MSTISIGYCKLLALNCRCQAASCEYQALWSVHVVKTGEHDQWHYLCDRCKRVYHQKALLTEITELRELKSQMVGTLYPSIIDTQLEHLERELSCVKDCK